MESVALNPRFLILAPALFFGACAYQTSRTSVVVVTDADKVVASCTKLGEIDGVSGYEGFVPVDKTRDIVLARLKIRGAELGGTHVFSTVADVKWKGLKTTGTVYRCSTG